MLLKVSFLAGLAVLLGLARAQVSMDTSSQLSSRGDTETPDDQPELQAFLVAAPSDHHHHHQQQGQQGQQAPPGHRSPCGHSHHHDSDNEQVDSSSDASDNVQSGQMSPTQLLMQLAYSNLFATPPRVPRYEERQGRPPCRCGCRCGHGVAPTQSPCQLCAQRPEGFRPPCCGARYAPHYYPIYVDAATGAPISRSPYSAYGPAYGSMYAGSTGYGSMYGGSAGYGSLYGGSPGYGSMYGSSTGYGSYYSPASQYAGPYSPSYNPYYYAYSSPAAYYGAYQAAAAASHQSPYAMMGSAYPTPSSGGTQATYASYPSYASAYPSYYAASYGSPAAYAQYPASSSGYGPYGYATARFAQATAASAPAYAYRPALLRRRVSLPETSPATLPVSPAAAYSNLIAAALRAKYLGGQRVALA